MQRSIFVLVISVIFALAEHAATGQEPQKKPDAQFPPAPTPLPGPQSVPAPIVVLPEMPRPGTREQWRYYGVDSFGRFRPRVILSPYGSYYLYNLQPFPWTSNRTTNFMPYALD